MAQIDDFKTQKHDNTSSQLSINGSVACLRQQVLEVDKDMQHVLNEMCKFDWTQKQQITMLQGIMRYLDCKRLKLKQLYNFTK